MDLLTGSTITWIRWLLEEAIWEVFFNGFCLSLVNIGVLAVLALILINHLGSSLGVPLLFWVQPSGIVGRLRQLFIGVGVGVLIWQVFLAGYLSEEFASDFTWDRPPFCETRLSQEFQEPQEPQASESAKQRFRYEPTDILSFWRYIGTVVAAGVTVFLLVMLITFVLAKTLGETGAPFKSTWQRWHHRHEYPSPPYAVYLPLGILLGLGFMTAASWLFLSGPAHPISEFTGKGLVSIGGWGNQAGRKALLRSYLQSDNTLEPHKNAKIYQQAQREEEDWLQPYNRLYGLFLLTFLGVFLYTLLLAWGAIWVRWLTPAGWLIFFLHLLVAVNILTAFFVPLSGQLVLGMLVGLAIFAGRTYKCRIPGIPFGKGPVNLEQRYKELAQRTSAQNTSPTLANEEISWPSTREGKKPPLALVCASGGGSRSALWTLSVLAELERAFLEGSVDGLQKEEKPYPSVAFPYFIRLVTGASGGMLGGSVYVASLNPPTTTRCAGKVERIHKRAGQNAQDSLIQLIQATTQDFLGPIVHRLGTRDLWSVLMPFRLPYDRGWALEESWRKAYHGILDQTFAQLQPGEKAGWRPSLVFSPMLVEDGRQLFISNLRLGSVTRNLAHLLPATTQELELLSREGIELFDLFSEAHNDLQVGTAARLSASFPYILPAAILPTNPPRRVVDAGYFDNYGVGIVTSWLANHLDWLRDHTSGVVLIQIRDGLSKEIRCREAVEDSFPSLIDRGLQWLTTPPEGLWQSRMSANVFRNDNLIHLLTQLFRCHNFAPDFFKVVNFEFDKGQDVSLNFKLTEKECKWILEGIKDIRPSVHALLDWWHSR